MTPCLNWRELELLVQKIKPEVEGLFVDRIIVPERPLFPDQYLKGEWIIRLTGRKQEGAILFSIRPRHPYLGWLGSKGPKASIPATRSPFDLSLSKYLRGAKLLECTTLPQERVAILWFSEEGQAHQKLGLILVFIPAAPEAFLVTANKNSENQEWKILCRSRTIRDESKIQKTYTLPNGWNAPVQPPIRSELTSDSVSIYRILEQELKLEAFEKRVQEAQKILRQNKKQAQERMRQSTTAVLEGQREEDWQRLGDLLKSSLHHSPPLEGSVRYVTDFSMEDGSEQKIAIPCNPQFTLKQQVEKFYQNARRKQRRIQEAQTRLDQFKEAFLKFEKMLLETPVPLDWEWLKKIETLAGTVPVSGFLSSSEKLSEKKSQKNRTAWLGKTFTSRDGLLLWVGRSKDENLELTFKQARGNDIWMHVRGKPGAHLVIPLRTGKSAPLETLLDAAHLTLYYSGGEKWGKTEVDYTFKKYVKRIKDSTEASYTHNKTLLIETDIQRMKRLLDQHPG